MLDFNFKGQRYIYETAVGLTALTLIVVGCLIVMAPFFTAILLATIFALSGWPAFEWARHHLRFSPAQAAAFVTLLLAGVFILPFVIIGTSISENFASIMAIVQDSLRGGNLARLSDQLQHIPWVGPELAESWRTLISDSDRIKNLLQNSAKPISQHLISLGGAIAHGILQLGIAIIIAYFFFRHGSHAAVRVRTLSEKFGGERGQHLLDITKKTLIGVVYGILGTALAQGSLAAFGFWLSGVPGASLLGLLVAILSFIPVGPPLIWVPAAYWLFSEGHTGWSIFLAIWGLFVISGIDNILKPYFISLGSNLPFVLVLFGIGGGVLGFGFVGLFIGPTLLAMAYSLIIELSSSRAASEEKLPSPASPPHIEN